VSGLAAFPSSSLVNRAAAYLEAGPASSTALVRDVLGLGATPRAMAARIAQALVGGDPRVMQTPEGRWALIGTAPDAASPTLDTCRFAVVDVETTGASVRAGGRIVEIAVVVLDGTEPRVAFQSLVNPGVPISPFVSRLTGISDAALRAAPPFEKIADAVLGSLAGSVFVAHSVRFDWAFVAAELERARGLLLQGPRLCTVRLARRFLPPLDRRNLDTVADFLGITIEGRHRATGDAVATARVFSHMLGVAQSRGAVTLRDLSQPPARPPARPRKPPCP
jgi:DNA polymerase-3 subunit epsilon